MARLSRGSAITDSGIVLPSFRNWQEPDIWRPLTNLAWGFLGGVAGGAGIVAALPTRGGTDEETRRELAEIKSMMVVMLAAKESEATDAARAEAKSEAIERTLAEQPQAARELAAGDTVQGFETLEAAARADTANAVQTWRDIGALAYDTDPGRALRAYREAVALDPSDFAAWIYLSRLEQNVAGDITAARHAAEAASRAASSDRERSLALNELGDTAMKAGDLADAASAYEEGLQLARSLTAANPGLDEAKRDVSVSLDRIGDTAMKSGDLAAAKAAYMEGLELARSLSAANPGSARAKRDVSVSLDRLGDAASQASDLSGAKTAYTEGLEMRRSLSASNPGSAEAKRDVIVSLWKLAQLTGDKAHWREALPIAEDMAAKGQLAPVDGYLLDHIRAQAVP